MLQQVKRAALRLLGPDDDGLLAGISLEYSYEDLAAATGDFWPENRLGAGAAGTVYRGILRGGTEVAIKVLAASDGGLNGFEDELRVLSRFRHPNLVTLLGWGQGEGEDPGTKYLVYELLTGGDLAGRLRRCRMGEEPFLWNQRLRVALDAACGLSHMVNSEPKAFHRDIKPPNILLDANGSAKMADFGLSATIKKQGQGHLTVENISGTPGYADPVYIQSGRVTETSEVYSFGTVLLELLLNERPAVMGPRGEVLYPLVQLVQPAAPGASERILARLDPDAHWPHPVVDEFTRLALGCVAGRAEARPCFEEVVEKLRRLCQSSGAAAGAGISPPQPFGAGHVPAWGEGPLKVPEIVDVVGGFQSSRLETATDNLASDASQLQLLDVAAKEKALKLVGMKDPSGTLLARRHCASPICKQSGTWGAAKLPDMVGGQAPPDSEPATVQAPNVAGRFAAAARRVLDEPVAEVVLECVFAEGVDLSALPPAACSFAFPVQFQSSRFVAVVGRQHQPGFFEALVPRRELLGSVSRVHFELSLMPGAGGSVVLRRLSGNPLALDAHPLEREAATPVCHGARLSFGAGGGAGGASPGNSPFLVLRIALRSRGDVGRDGPHPSVTWWANSAETVHHGADAKLPPAPAAPAACKPQSVPLTAAAAQAAPLSAALECSHAQGQEAGLQWLPAEARAIALPREGEVLELGRSHQHGFFEQLLRAEPSWLAFISRSHCRITVLPQPTGSGASEAAARRGCRLKVENLSANVVIVGGRGLARGHSDIIVEGGTLAFVARGLGDAAGSEIEFLRFVLRGPARPAVENTIIRL